MSKGSMFKTKPYNEAACSSCIQNVSSNVQKCAIWNAVLMPLANVSTASFPASC